MRTDFPFPLQRLPRRIPAPAVAGERVAREPRAARSLAVVALVLGTTFPLAARPATVSAALTVSLTIQAPPCTVIAPTTGGAALAQGTGASTRTGNAGIGVTCPAGTPWRLDSSASNASPMNVTTSTGPSTNGTGTSTAEDPATVVTITW